MAINEAVEPLTRSDKKLLSMWRSSCTKKRAAASRKPHLREQKPEWKEVAIIIILIILIIIKIIMIIIMTVVIAGRR